jgi:double-stranded uracil-DNA glycosylase
LVGQHRGREDARIDHHRQGACRVRFTRQELEAHAGALVDDLVGDEVRLAFVGINPGLWTAATNSHFAHPSNRFYPALRLAGIVTRNIPPTGMNDEDRAHLTDRGIAITNLVARATARASELTTAELRAGGAALVERVRAWAPAVVAVAGVTAYRSAFRQSAAQLGRQEDDLAGAELWVVPNPSGLNAHETVASLADWYGRVADAAGIDRGI